MKIALVSYLNTRPFTDALADQLGDQAELLLLPPAECAAALRDGRADIALTPSGALPDLQGVRILPDYCLGATGAVGSVFLFSETPAEGLSRVLLDPHSRTSNGLARILFRYHWKKEVTWVSSPSRPFDQIRGLTAGVAIGDEAIRAADHYPFVYDLSLEWRKLTGWPFVFAVWVYRPDRVSARSLAAFNKALETAPGRAAESARTWSATYGISPEFGEIYLTQRIQYRFDATKHRAFQAYLNALEKVDSLVSPIH